MEVARIKLRVKMNTDRPGSPLLFNGDRNYQKEFPLAT